MVIKIIAGTGVLVYTFILLDYWKTRRIVKRIIGNQVRGKK